MQQCLVLKHDRKKFRSRSNKNMTNDSQAGQLLVGCSFDRLLRPRLPHISHIASCTSGKRPQSAVILLRIKTKLRPTTDPNGFDCMFNCRQPPATWRHLISAPIHLAVGQHGNPRWKRQDTLISGSRLCTAEQSLLTFF